MRERSRPAQAACVAQAVASLYAGAVPALSAAFFCAVGDGKGRSASLSGRMSGERPYSKENGLVWGGWRAVTASVRPCPAKRAFASVMDNGAFCACSATVPVARPLGREREFDGGPGRVPVAPAAWGAFQTQQGFASPRPALFPVDLAVGEE